MKQRLVAVILLLSVFAIAADKKPKQVEVKVQKTNMTREQEIQLGKEAGAEVEREMEVVKNAEVEAWLNQIGQTLAKTPQSNAYPYYFKLVNEDSINAFALPGGPMYVHTGLIKAADSEGEVAGVLAHEMSHVALRHGAANMAKQQTYGTIFGAIGAAAGIFTASNGQCGMLCQATQMGAGLGAQSVLSKFSRGYEKDADLNGARMMASAGYNPIEVANFFAKLEKQSGAASGPSKLEMFLSSHPSPGNRVKYVTEDTQFYQKKNYTAGTSNFARVKQNVGAIPPAKLKPAQLLAPQGQPRQGALPSGFKEYPAKGFSFLHPESWQAGQGEGGGSVYSFPQGGAVKAQNGGPELILGIMVDYYVPQAGAGSVNLQTSTNEFVELLKKGDASMKIDSVTQGAIGAQPAMLVKGSTKTSNAQDPNQLIVVYTVARQAGLWYMVFAVPPTRAGEVGNMFKLMTETVVFPADGQ